MRQPFRSGTRVVALTLCLFLPMPFTGCGGGTNPGGDNVLRLTLRSAPNRLDPAYVVDVAEGEICALIFQGLVRFSPEGHLVPDAASSWAIEDDGRQYVFRLDPNAAFADGRRVTAEDVLFSFQRVLAAETASPRRWVLDRIGGASDFHDGIASGISGLSAPDAETVVIKLDAPFKPFLSMLAMPAAMIVPATVDQTGDAAPPQGSGVWKLNEWIRGDFISLVPNVYHPDPVVELTELRFRIIPEAFTRIAEFESGSLDVLEIPTAEVRRFRADPRFTGRIHDRADLRVYYIGLNTRDEILSDPRVRRALNMAVDVPRLIDVLAAGEGIPAHGAVPPGLPGYVARDGYRHDPAMARQLLAEAGYPSGISIEIWQRESPEGNRLLEAVQGYMREAGVNATLVRREWSAFKEAVSAGRVDAFFLDWFADYPDAENFLYPLFHTSNAGGGGNRTFFADPVVDAILERAAVTLDDALGAALYATADSLVHAQAPWIYLYFPRSAHVVSERVENFQLPTLYLGADYRAVRLKG